MLCSIHVIASQVVPQGGMRVGKGKSYNRECAANATPGVIITKTIHEGVPWQP